MKSQFLNELSYNRVLEFNNLLQEQRFYPGDIIYDQAAESGAFYVVKRGKVAVEYAVEIESENAYPQKNGKSWEIEMIKKKCLYKVRDLEAGEIFGHDELLKHFNNVLQSGDGHQKIPKRQYRIVALEKSDVFFINIAKFYYFFTDSELKKMQAHIVPIDKKDIQDKVRGNFTQKRQNQDALLSGMNTNQVKSNESAGQRRHLSIKESKVFKLDPWLDRVKKKQMCSPEINAEAARIKVLDVERQYRYIHSKEAYLADFQVHQGDILRMIERDQMIADH